MLKIFVRRHASIASKKKSEKNNVEIKKRSVFRLRLKIIEPGVRKGDAPRRHIIEIWAILGKILIKKWAIKQD